MCIRDRGQYVLTAAPPANGVATLPAIAVSGAAVDPEAQRLNPPTTAVSYTHLDVYKRQG